MKEIFIISKNTSLPNYLFSLINDLCPNSLTLAVDFNPNLDIVVIDSETITPEDVPKLNFGGTTLIFTDKIKPFLIQYTSRFDISGVISLNMEADDILKTVQAAINDDMYYNDTMIGLLFSNNSNELAKRVASITEREQEILIMMMKDMTNEEIAEELSLSVRTINAHKGNIMRKIGCKTTSGLVQILMDYSASFKNIQ